MKTTLIRVLVLLSLMTSPWSGSRGLAQENTREMWRFAFGTSTSVVRSGFTKVTVDDAFTTAKGYGFQSKEGLMAFDRGGAEIIRPKDEHTASVYGAYRTTSDLTCALIEGAADNAFHNNNTSTPESRVMAPADMIALGDVAHGRASSAPPGFPGKIFTSVGTFDEFSTNRAFWPGMSHNGKANMVFCDGHVESARQTNWVAATDRARARWNNDNQPHRETWKRP